MHFRKFVGILVSLLIAMSAIAEARAASRFSAITVDARTGSVLFSDAPDAQRYPASLTKMMTLYILFQELKSGRIKMSTPLQVSSRASRMAPSKLGVKPGSAITVEQAIKALIIKSANDVASVVGENLGASESEFAERMTRTARDLGMSRTTYRNASGLPNPGQITTARDQATLSLRIMRDFPQFYPYFRLQGFTFKGRTIRSHNRLVGRFPGTDGLKTGYTGASGYNLATSTRRGDKRLVGVVLGAQSAGRRNAYMMAMLNRQFVKARDGSTVAALAGSSAGVIDPIAIASAATIAAEPELPPAESTAAVADMAEQASAATDEDSAEMDSDQLAVLTRDGGPQVVEARLKPEPVKLPFAIKTVNAGATKIEDVGSESEGGDWNVQVGMFNSKDAALEQLSSLRSKLKSLEGRAAGTDIVRSKKRNFYRARFLGFDREEARTACESIKSLGATCLALSPRS